ncbi:MAG: hypothetical protein VR65_11135 [Desulfobulbaceae bacterium BRH_c16a]|nr:MAG: hypothetical protein VR65_11135 [Desulfobulbaceae bacterium BRH_c16a]
MTKNLPVAITCIALIAAAALWMRGFLQSPMVHPERKVEGKFIAGSRQADAPNPQREKILAASYWQRYRDIRENGHWGEKGSMGIWGPRDHFRKHGKREGRIFAPIIKAEDAASEKRLAESYWKRYPDVRNSSVWGKESDLQLLGPRDHFIHIGRFEGRIWEQAENTGE